MTAINVIRQAAAVHILTDGAGYRSDGNLAFRVQKVFPIAHLNAVIAARGSPLFPPMFAHHASIRARSLGHLIALTPEIAREEIARLPDAAEPDFDLIVAGWLDDGPISFGLSNHDRHGFEAWRTVALGPISLSPFADEIKADLDLAYPSGIEPNDFDPFLDGLRVLEIQRRHPVEHRWKGNSASVHHAVGAFAQLTTVTHDAISTRILRRWADEIGQPIGGLCVA